MSILGDKRLVPKKVQTTIYIQYIDTTTDHITPCSRMRARGNKVLICSAGMGLYTHHHKHHRGGKRRQSHLEQLQTPTTAPHRTHGTGTTQDYPYPTLSHPHKPHPAQNSKPAQNPEPPQQESNLNLGPRPRKPHLQSHTC